MDPKLLFFVTLLISVCSPTGIDKRRNFWFGRRVFIPLPSLAIPGRTNGVSCTGTARGCALNQGCQNNLCFTTANDPNPTIAQPCHPVPNSCNPATCTPRPASGFGNCSPPCQVRC